jgi:DnaJ-class molecular chaperone
MSQKRVVASLYGGVLALTVSFGVSRPAAAEVTALLRVTSDPAGASVFLDDERTPRGKTPVVLKGVPRGRHTVRVTLDGYADEVKEVTAVPGRLNSVAFKLVAASDASRPGGGEQGPAGERRAEEAEGPEIPRTIEVTCPACGGTGLTKETGCLACKAVGYIGLAPCRDCGGTGRAEYKCPACGGEGKITHRGKEYECPQCGGKGYPPCGACRGKGTITRPNPEAAGRPTQTCPICEGSGFECHAKCERCNGTGNYRISEPDRDRRSRDRDARISETIPCPFCDGKGEGRPICRRCQGRGIVGPDRAPYPCPACYGTGHVFQPCRACGGRGWIFSRER